MTTLIGLLLMLAAPPEFDLDAARWKQRVLVLCAASADDAQLRSQRDWLRGREPEFADRDLVVVPAVGDATLRQRLCSGRAGFRVVLIGKDGTVKLERGQPVRPEAIYRLIDGMPMRREEMRQRRQ